MTRPDLRSISASRSSRVSLRSGFSFLAVAPSPCSASSSPSPRSSPASSFCLSISASSRVLCFATPAPSIVSRALSNNAASSSSSSSPFTGFVLSSWAPASSSSRLRFRESEMSSSVFVPTLVVPSSFNTAFADSASSFFRCMASIFFLSLASFFLFFASLRLGSASMSIRLRFIAATFPPSYIPSKQIFGNSFTIKERGSISIPGTRG
mmetsp:Transcript_3781/g.7088  ORF Transcript_3781/g.7088 Transcript_3781/m.7088 type:complete len:209 (-) Transcript_3781:387-1013(-)